VGPLLFLRVICGRFLIAAKKTRFNAKIYTAANQIKSKLVLAIDSILNFSNNLNK